MDGDLDGFINAYLTASATGEIPDGAKVEIYGQYEGWYVVHYGGYVGYASAQYIR